MGKSSKASCYEKAALLLGEVCVEYHASKDVTAARAERRLIKACIILSLSRNTGARPNAFLEEWDPIYTRHVS